MLSALTYAMCLADAHCLLKTWHAYVHSCVLLSSQGEITVQQHTGVPFGDNGSGPRACTKSRAALLHSLSIRDLDESLAHWK
jgi:hypothetical protein